MNKGYGNFRKKGNSAKSQIKSFATEHQHIQKAAHEAKFMSGQMEKMYKSLHELVMGQSDVIGSLINLMIKKEICTIEEINEGISSYGRERVNAENETQIRAMGFGDKIEVVEGSDSLVKVNLGISTDEGLLPSFPKDLFFITGRTYLYPGLEEQLVGMRVDDRKKFTLTMPVDFKIKQFSGVTFGFDAKVLDIRKKIVEDKDGQTEADRK